MIYLEHAIDAHTSRVVADKNQKRVVLLPEGHEDSVSFSNVMIEGTPDEIRQLATRIWDAAGHMGAEQ